MRMFTMILVATAMTASCMYSLAASFVPSVSVPGSSPVVSICAGDQPTSARIRLQHTHGPWDVPAPPDTIERDIVGGAAELVFTEIAFGVNTLDLLTADGTVLSSSYVEKWVTPAGDHYLRIDTTNFLFCSTIRTGTPDMPSLAAAPLYRGQMASISLLPQTGTVAAGTIVFSCSQDGTCAVWSGDRRIAARRSCRAGETKTIVIDPRTASANEPLTVRLENGYHTVILPLTPGQVPGWPAVGTATSAGEPPMGGSGTSGSDAAGHLGNFVVTRCAVHTQTDANGGRVKIEFSACAAIVTPPEGDQPGVINTAGILTSGTWVRVANPGAIDQKNIYVYRADDGRTVTGIARWTVDNKTAVFEGALTINAHGVSTDFIDELVQGSKPLPIAIMWGVNNMAWSPVLSWLQVSDGSWKGTLNQ